MLEQNIINTEVLQFFFETLYANIADDYKLVILQDRQDVPRPVDSEGNLKNYIFYRVEAPHTIQWQTKQIYEKDGVMYQKTRTQKQLHVRVNFMGQRAADLSTYFDHAVNSELGYFALRPTIDGVQYEFYYNNHTDPTDLTEIEQTKWVARVEFELVLGYVDSADFPIDVFTEIEAQEIIEAAGQPSKPIIIKTGE